MEEYTPLQSNENIKSNIGSDLPIIEESYHRYYSYLLYNLEPTTTSNTGSSSEDENDTPLTMVDQINSDARTDNLMGLSENVLSLILQQG